MNSFNKKLLMIIVILGLLPIVPGVIAALSPIGLGLVILFGLAVFAPLRRGFLAVFGGLFSLLSDVLGFFFKGLVGSLLWLFGAGFRRTRFMGYFERSLLLRSSNKGFLVDGRRARLSETASYESLMIQGGMGRGKSSAFVMPNLLLPSSSEPSFVISDTSGEIYQKTAGFLARRGYQIRVINLMDLNQSESYNPLEHALAPHEIAELAKTLVSASTGRGSQMASDPFWEQSAEKLIRIMAQCLQNQSDPSFRNLANLRHLITSFDAHIAPKGQLGKIDQFVLAATQNDPSTFGAYQAFVQGNMKTIQSVLMSADVALDPVVTPQVAALTARSSFDLNTLRQGKVALYVMVNQTQMDVYAFFLNLFYAQLFKTLLKDHHNPGRPIRRTAPVWLFLDEFGHLQIPGFEVFATTARKYKVVFALFLQSMAQLESRYGAVNARVIQEGLATEIYLPGMALDTARALEARLGRLKNSPLMPANEIIRMKAHQALMLHANRLPIRLNTKRYFQRFDLARRSRMAPAPLPQTPAGAPPLIQL